MAKNPHAVALGRRTSARKALSSAQNGRSGGRPRRYRVTREGIERRDGERWLLLEPPYPAAVRAFLRRHSR